MRKKLRPFLLPCAVAVPALLLGLFFLLRGNRAAMDGWVFTYLTPAAQLLGRFWSVLPFSVAEVMTAAFLVWAVVYPLRALVGLVRTRALRVFARRCAVLLAVFLWVGALVCWMWNAAYYASSFSQRSGIEARPCSVEELTAVTEHFAQRAAQYAVLVERDADGSFAVPRGDCLDGALSVYTALEEEIPFLRMSAVRAKPLFFSRLQSILGFTGVYFPLTGEANVNMHFPSVLLPATIAHEMAHQRMVASELEANFVAIAACVTHDDPVFVYSGYLLGLIQLCNALYPEDAQAWTEVVQKHFNEQLAHDWNENSAYWRALESELEQAAENAYDAFLRGNDQELGIRSYGACVDLLVTWYMEREADA